MKKGLLSLLAVALTVVGCQNYDDQFSDLNTKIAALQAGITGLATVSADVKTLSTTVSGLNTSISANGVKSDGLATGLATAQTAIDALTASLLTVASAADLTAITEALAVVKADVKEILAANSVINQAVSITSEATLEYAESLISSKTDAPNVIINGIVTVNFGTAPFNTADQEARLHAITGKIATILKATTVTNSSVLTLPLTNLGFVDAAFTHTGPVSYAKLRTVTGNMQVLTANYIGAADFTTISNIGGTFEITDSVSMTSLNLKGVVITGTINTTGAAASTLVLAGATSVDVGTAAVISLTAASATDVDLGHVGALASLALVTGKALTIDIAATSIAGTLGITSSPTAVIHMDALTSAGATTIGASGEFHAPKLSGFSGATTIAAAVVDLSGLTQTVSATLALSGAHTAGLNLPKLVISGNALTAAAAKIITVKSITSVVGEDLLITAAATDITILAAGKTDIYNVDTSSACKGTLKNLTVTGADNASPSEATQSNGVVVDSNAAALLTLTTAGMIADVSVIAAPLITTIVTAGETTALTATSNPKLTTLTVGHDHIEGNDGAKLDVQSNVLLKSLSTPNLNEVKTLIIKGNTHLSALDLSGIVEAPGGTVSGDIEITGNALVGVWNVHVIASETDPAVPTRVRQNALSHIAQYIITKSNPAASTVTYTFELSADDYKVDAVVATKTHAEALALDNAVGTNPFTWAGNIGDGAAADFDGQVELATVTTTL